MKRSPSAQPPVGTDWADEFRASGFPDDHAKLLASCLAARPEKRPANAEVLAEQLSHMYRAAWRKGLKTTYYLRTQQASDIEKISTKLNKEVGMYATKQPREYSEGEKDACSIEALLNGGECEACQ